MKDESHSANDLTFYKEISSHETLSIDRKLIKNAAYNPRKITKKERENLYRILDSHKLVENLVWNERTGNLVSGHQRLTWIDLKAKDKGLKEFCITVNKIDVDEKEEKEINIGMNNDAAMGKFDIDMLDDLLEGIDYDLAGFDDRSLSEIMGGEIDYETLNDTDLELRANAYEEGIAHRKRMQAASQNGSVDYYTVLVFKDGLNRQEFFAMLGIKDEDYIDGNKVTETIREKFVKR